MTGENDDRRKRFYQAASVSAPAGDPPTCRVLLDGRGVRTPAKRELAVPSRELAEALAAEWDAQVTHINPLSMPLTRLVNSALDGVTGREAEVRASILAYAGSDLLCYLAPEPIDLVTLQSKRWGTIHAWAKDAHGVELALAVGVMPVAQDPAMLAKIDAGLGKAGPIALAGLHVMTALTGSLLLAVAVRQNHITAEEAWSLAHIDEDFQIAKWGQDEAAAIRRKQRWLEMSAAARAVAWAGEF